MANLKNTTINDTGFFKLPVGDTAARPGFPNARQIRFNTETGKLEQFRPSVGDWIAPSNTGVIATGGDSVYDVDVEGTTYRVHVFTATGTSTFSVLQGGEAEYLIVAGGGAGGLVRGGGGGAGGLISGTTALTAQSYTITVGAGGSGGKRSTFDALDNAENSSAFGLIALGGGVGGRRSESSEPPSDGGSGGGEGGAGGAGQGVGIGLQPTSASGGFGNNGGTGVSSGSTYSGGGGGGAGGNGKDGINANGGNGGVGLISFLAGTPVFYSGGGGGHSDNGNPRGEGGLGGGGFSGIGNDPVLGNADSGTANTGGGGGGGGYDSNVNISGDGGSGIVIIRYPLRQENPVTAPGRAVSDGLVLDLDFSKPTVYSGSGSVVTDSRLNGIEGNLVNGPEFVNPRTHRSTFTFNASNQYITGSQNNINLGENLTITGWFNSQHNTNTNRTVVSIGNRADTPGVHWIFLPRTGLSSYGSISYLYRENGANGRGLTSSEDNLVDGNYHWFAYVIQPTGIRCFIDGSLSTSNSDSQSNYVFTNKIFHVAADGVGGQVFDGGISYIRVYDRALLDSEAINLFNATRWRFGV